MENFKRAILLTIIFSSLSIYVVAQSRMSGRVGGDGEDKVLPFANILLLQAMDSSII